MTFPNIFAWQNTIYLGWEVGEVGVGVGVGGGVGVGRVAGGGGGAKWQA